MKNIFLLVSCTVITVFMSLAVSGCNTYSATVTFSGPKGMTMSYNGKELNGLVLEIAPGTYIFKFSAPGHKTIWKSCTISSADNGSTIPVQLEAERSETLVTCSTDKPGKDANGFGLMTIAQNREELEAEAMNHLRNAKDKKANYISDLSLLREAAREFEAAIRCFEQITPAPPELKEAITGFKAVNALRVQKLKECNNEFKRCHRRMDYSGMARACQDIMKIAGEKSKTYREAAETLRSVKRTMDKRR